MMCKFLPVTADELAAMIAEYDQSGTSTCPRCGQRSQPWAGFWFCECGAVANNFKELSA